MFSWMRPKSRLRASISASGLLSSSATGLVREISVIAASQRTPTRAIPIGAEDVMDVKVLPYIEKIAYRGVEIVGEHRERCGIDRARRCAAKDGKRALFWVRQELPHRLQHADLIGGPGAASGENEPRFGFG